MPVVPEMALYSSLTYQSDYSRAVHDLDLLDLLGLHDLSDPPPLPDRPSGHRNPDGRKDHRVGLGHDHKLNDLAIGDCARRKVG